MENVKVANFDGIYWPQKTMPAIVVYKKKSGYIGVPYVFGNSSGIEIERKTLTDMMIEIRKYGFVHRVDRSPADPENIVCTIYMHKVHELKCATEYFNEVCAGRKNFELRKDDRDYIAGDILVLKEWNAEHGYSGKTTRRIEIKYVLRNYEGLMPGYCILGL